MSNDKLKFSEQETEFAKTLGNLRLDLNYDTLDDAKDSQEPLWLQWIDSNWNEKESIELTLVEAEWLAEQLQSFIKLLKS